MPIVNTNIYKGVAIQQETDKTKKIVIQPGSGSTTATTTTLTAAQTADRTITLPDATDTLVGKATTDVLTNKTLNGNTATNLISGSGQIVFNTTGVITVPNATDTLVGKATTDVLTNKTLTGNTAANLISGSGTLVLNTTGTITVPNGTDTLATQTYADDAAADVASDLTTHIADTTTHGTTGDIVGTTDAQAITGKTLLEVDNLQLNGNTIASTDTDGDIVLSPNGTGKVAIDNLSLSGNTIISTDTNGNIVLDPNGTGVIQPSAHTVPSADFTHNLGSSTTRFNILHSAGVTLYDISGISNTILTQQNTDPSSTSVNLNIKASSNGGLGLGINTSNNATANATATGEVIVETGNKTAGTGNSGNITLKTGTSSGGSRGDIILNGLKVQTAANFEPSSSDSLHLGSSSARFGTLSLNQIDIYDGATIRGNIEGTDTMPSGNTSHLSVYAQSTYNLGLFTDPGATSGSVFIDTGAGSAGNSGDIKLFTGNSTGGTRGEIDLSARRIGITGPLTLTSVQTNAATGSSADLSAPTKSIVVLTDSGLVSLRSVASPNNGQLLILVNDTGNAINILDEDAGATAANRIITGTGANLVLDNDASIWLAYDSNDSRWRVIGGSGSGDASASSGINYIENTDAEVDTAGFATYADAAAALPVDGTGGSANITWTRATSTPLRGTANFLYTKDAANRQGQGVSYDFTIDVADKAKILSISFDYALASGTYSDGGLAVYIYDVTNAIVIQPSGYNILSAVQDLPQKHIATFQTASNSTSYRLIIHNATTSTSAFTIKFDNFELGPQKIAYGAAITDWKTFTPTGSASANVTYTSGYMRRVGDTGEFVVQMTWTGSGAADGHISLILPFGLNIDTAKMYAANRNETLGVVSYYDSGTAQYFGAIQYLSATQVHLQISRTDSAYGSSVDLTPSSGSPATPASGDILTAKWEVPILGWSSNVQMSSDTDTRVVAMRAVLTTSQTGVTSKVVPYNSATIDTHAGLNTTTGVYTVPVPGIYRVSATVLLGAMDGATDSRIELRKNGSSFAQVYGHRLASGGATGAENKADDLVSCVAGDTLSVFITGDASFDIDNGSSRTLFSVERLSGPAQVAATDEIYAEYTSSSTTLVHNVITQVVFPTKVMDSHNAYNTSTGVYTCPAPGRYFVNFWFQSAAPQTPASAAKRISYAVLRQNGADKIYGPQWISLQAATSTTAEGYACGILNCNAGDTITTMGYQNLGVNGPMPGGIDCGVSIHRIK